jgi:hypothetical protein
MFTYNTISLQQSFSSSISENQNSREAMQLFQTANLQARLSQFWSKISRRPNSLLDLNEVTSEKEVNGRHYAGIRAVGINQIRGSEGRTGDFDVNFKPLTEKTRDRWLSIAKAQLDGTPLPAVELIKVGEEYFVRDGHHRISVAQALGQETIDAQVSIWETP